MESDAGVCSGVNLGWSTFDGKSAQYGGTGVYTLAKDSGMSDFVVTISRVTCDQSICTEYVQIEDKIARKTVRLESGKVS